MTKTIITFTIFIVFMLSGCAGFSGWVYRDEDGTVYWNANRPCIIKDTKKGIELDGKGQKIIDIDIVNALKK